MFGTTIAQRLRGLAQESLFPHHVPSLITFLHWLIAERLRGSAQKSARRRRSMRRVILLFTLALVCLCIPAWAQDTAEILGAVSDSTGAVVPGAKITVSNPAKGFVRELTANATGNYD